MNLPTISFRDLLGQFAAASGRAYDPLQNVDDLSISAKIQFASWLNTAMDRVWRAPNSAFAWKWTTTSGPLTVGADGSIAWSAIQNSDDWFNLWSQDPRPAQNPPSNMGWFIGNPAYAIPCSEDTQAFWPRTTLGTIWGFWRLPRPRFNNAVVVSANNYSAGQIVFDETATGHCYLALVNNAAGNALSDASQWAVQAPPDRVGNVLAEAVETMRLQAKGSEGSSGVNKSDFDTWLDIEMSRELPRDGSGAPWEYNRWHQFYRGYCQVL